jgi:hypothetical protein
MLEIDYAAIKFSEMRDDRDRWKRKAQELVAALRNIIAGNGGECGCAETARAAIAKAEQP